MRNLSILIDEALDACKACDPDNSVRVTTREVVEWLRENRGDEIAEFDRALSDAQLQMKVRERRKQRTPEEESMASKQICIDFGLSPLDLDSEISIPRNRDELLGSYYWKEANDATLEEISLHADSLDAQASKLEQKAGNWRKIVRSALRYGNKGMTLGACRAIATQPPPKDVPSKPPTSAKPEADTDEGKQQA